MKFPAMDNVKVSGKMADLNEIGITFFKAAANSALSFPVTVLESSVPFIATYHASDNGNEHDELSVFSVNNQGKWSMSINGSLEPDSPLFFTAVKFDCGKEHAVFDYNPEQEGNEGKALFESYLTPFMQEYDDFTGSVVGISPCGIVAVEELGISSKGYFPEEMLESTELLKELGKKKGINAVAIHYQNEHSDDQIHLYLDIGEMKLFYLKR